MFQKKLDHGFGGPVFFVTQCRKSWPVTPVSGNCSCIGSGCSSDSDTSPSRESGKALNLSSLGGPGRVNSPSVKMLLIHILEIAKEADFI